MGGRTPKGLFGGAAGLLLLGGGAIVISNSLFNGMARDALFVLLLSSLLSIRQVFEPSVPLLISVQLMEVTEQSNTHELVEWARRSIRKVDLAPEKS